jgi:hypothetical protein
MPVEKRMVPVIKVGTIPADSVIIEPCRSKFGLETFAEAAFGLGIDVDAFIYVCVHVKLSVLSFVWSGRWKFCGGGNGAGRDDGRLAVTSGRPGFSRESFPTFSQFGLAARFNLRR